MKIDYKIDCEHCRGYCCVALHFSKIDGFPHEKKAGEPCRNLKDDFRCRVHGNLKTLGLKGCLSFDCFGAGQWLAGQNEHLDSKDLEFRLFSEYRTLFSLHYYLDQALALIKTWSQLQPGQADAWPPLNLKVIKQYEELGAKIQRLEVTEAQEMARWQESTAGLLTQVAQLIVQGQEQGQDKTQIQVHQFWRSNLAGKKMGHQDWSFANFQGAILIAAQLNGCKFRGTNFLGADMRDCNIMDSDLSQGMFLTQSQLNSARGNALTAIPAHLSRPAHWD